MSRTIVLLYPRAEPDWPHAQKLEGLSLACLTIARPLWPAFRLLRRWCRWRTAQHRFGLALDWRVAYAWAWARRRLAWARAALGRTRVAEPLLGLRRGRTAA